MNIEQVTRDLLRDHPKEVKKALESIKQSTEKGEPTKADSPQIGGK